MQYSYKILFLLLLIATTAWGVPARRTVRTVTQPDGTQLRLTMTGDEWMHYWSDSQGKPMALDSASGWWRETGIGAATRARAAQRREASNARRIRRLAAGAEERKSNYVGKKRAIVILSQFQDVTFKVEEPQALYDQVFNTPGYSGYGMGGSVRDYFLAQSYGQLDITFDVVGPVTLPHNMSYYGANNVWGNDKRPGAFASTSITLAEELVDFSQYDWNGDGEVDQVYIIFAGYGEAQSGNTSEIWPHEWTLSEAKKAGETTILGALHLNGVVVDTYACSNELYGNSGIILDGIGTACHEFSHCLGLPDMYGSSYGMYQWDLMDYGNYNVEGYVPASYTAYERWWAGWIEPKVLDNPCTVTGMHNIDEEGECYIIYNRAWEDEFYMLQNIQQTGWNAGAAASGMLIFHVDYNEQAWIDNEVNHKASHQRMTPICADGQWSATTNKGDLWPWKEKDALTDESWPAATLFNANDDGRKFLGRPITDIRHQDGLLSFKFNLADVPVHSAAQDKRMVRMHDLLGRPTATGAPRGVYIAGGKKIAK